MVFSGSPATVSNFATVLATDGAGVFSLGLGLVINGAPTDTSALIKEREKVRVWAAAR